MCVQFGYCAKEELAKIRYAAGDVPTHVVRLRSLNPGAKRRASYGRENAVLVCGWVSRRLAQTGW